MDNLLLVNCEYSPLGSFPLSLGGPRSRSACRTAALGPRIPTPGSASPSRPAPQPPYPLCHAERRGAPLPGGDDLLSWKEKTNQNTINPWERFKQQQRLAQGSPARDDGSRFGCLGLAAWVCARKAASFEEERQCSCGCRGLRSPCRLLFFFFFKIGIFPRVLNICQR